MTAPLGCYQCDHCQVVGEPYEEQYVCRDCDATVKSTTVCKKCEADQPEVLDYYRTKGGTV